MVRTTNSTFDASAAEQINKQAARRLRVAVRKAIRAYKKYGRMLDAALVYAGYGFPVFPVSRTKVPIPRMDRDADGNEIPGTGGFKKATSDQDQIIEWWTNN